MRRLVQLLISDRLVMAVILLNTIALIGYEMAPRGAGVRPIWFWVDYACVGFFLLEAWLKIDQLGWRGYWSSSWNRFDLAVVLFSLPVLLSPVMPLHDFAFVLVLRLGRLFRLFRALRFIPNLDHLALGIRRALQASVGVFLALLLANLILAMAATLLFRDLDPERFGDPLRSSYSMFQVFTVEGWYEIPAELSERAAADGRVENPRTMAVGARLFFSLAVVVGGILGLSLANAVFVDQMMMDNTEPLEERVEALAEEIRRLRAELQSASRDPDRAGGNPPGPDPGSR